MSNPTVYYTTGTDGTLSIFTDVDGDGNPESVTIIAPNGDVTIKSDPTSSGSFSEVTVIQPSSSTVTTYTDTNNDGTLDTKTTQTPGSPAPTTETGTFPQSVCFLAGTMIATPEGEVAIETLLPGQLVSTVDGRALPVRWLGKQTIATTFADPDRSMPIRIRAGALADGVPARDLRVSPSHAMYVDGVLAHAGALVNGLSIVRETQMPESFCYYNIEFAEHALVMADGAPAESYVDNVSREHFDNWAEREALGEMAPIAELALPRAKAHRQLPTAIRVRLAARAAELFGEKAVAA